MFMLLLVAALAAPAQAHDSLVSSDPEDGATLDDAPTSITLTFSAEILEVTPVVRVSDGDGEVVQESTPEIDGRDAVAEIDEPLESGEYTVDWRVVSSDGHPIEGTFTFTVAGDDDEGAETTQEEQEPSDGGADATSDADTTEAADPADADDSGDPGMLALLVGVGVLVVVAGVVVLILGRRRKQ